MNFKEATGTSYNDINSLCFPFYTDRIIIVMWVSGLRRKENVSVD